MCNVQMVSWPYLSIRTCCVWNWKRSPSSAAAECWFLCSLQHSVLWQTNAGAHQKRKNECVQGEPTPPKMNGFDPNRFYIKSTIRHMWDCNVASSSRVLRSAMLLVFSGSGIWRRQYQVCRTFASAGTDPETLYHKPTFWLVQFNMLAWFSAKNSHSVYSKTTFFIPVKTPKAIKIRFSFCNYCSAFAPFQQLWPRKSIRASKDMKPPERLKVESTIIHLWNYCSSFRLLLAKSWQR